MAQFNRKEFESLRTIASLSATFENAVRGELHEEGKIVQFLKAQTPEELRDINRMSWISFYRMFKLGNLFASPEKKLMESQRAVLDTLKLREYFAESASRVEDMGENWLSTLMPEDLKTEENAALMEKYKFPTLASLMTP